MQSPDETLLSQYRYNALDQLIANTFPNEPEHQRFYCKSRLTTEIHGATRHSIIRHDVQLLAEQKTEGDALNSRLIASDQQRSVLNTLGANHSRQPIAYTPYGHRPAASGLLSLLGFNGERPDPVTGWYLLGNGYRPFNPVLMVFTSPDSLSPFGKGGLNCYAYCQGDPINKNDPTGHWPYWLVKPLGVFKRLKRPLPNEPLISRSISATDSITNAIPTPPPLPATLPSVSARIPLRTREPGAPLRKVRSSSTDSTHSYFTPTQSSLRAEAEASARQIEMLNSIPPRRRATL
ncbi:RHS repeat-associated core domain-containing protein [Pseudomonas sp. PCH199]|uniref:RHS repeat-associated core domain-containing protein n=1 Tax=unclassified Pseudomonas TaxID=196821 RepID=UPI000BDBBDD2|nr:MULTISPECIES: RHS repeat-associated core domain-containing protein [unclassified Pseudomonas]MCW8275667.1 RHS repeat-associated core domain-containing protein [Pseudomonas sp. PCH199]PAM84538.1 Rhs family protein [Pseudomonas sp. ERMR1:02]